MKALPGPTTGRAGRADSVRAMPGGSGPDSFGGFWIPALFAVFALVVATVFGGLDQALLVLVVLLGGVGVLVGFIYWSANRAQRQLEARLTATRQLQLREWIESLKPDPAPVREVTVTATVVEPEPLGELPPVRAEDATTVFGIVVEPHEAV